MPWTRSQRDGTGKDGQMSPSGGVKRWHVGLPGRRLGAGQTKTRLVWPGDAQMATVEMEKRWAQPAGETAGGQCCSIETQVVRELNGVDVRARQVERAEIFRGLGRRRGRDGVTEVSQGTQRHVVQTSRRRTVSAFFLVVDMHCMDMAIIHRQGYG